MSFLMDDPIEDALHTYALAETPANFSNKIMRQVRSTKNASMQFHLTWMDYALGLFLALLPAAGFLIWISLPQLALLQLEFQLQLLLTGILQPALVISLAVAGLMLFSVFLVSLNFLLRPRWWLA